MSEKLSKLDDKQLKRIQWLAKRYYPAACKAVLGLLLDYNKQNIDASLRASLNPLSRYTLDIDPAQWPTRSKWYIKPDSRPLTESMEDDKMDALVEENRKQILLLARENGIRNVRVFGSMARNDANESSDLDLLVELEEGRSGFALGGFLEAVTNLVHRKVDVVTEKSLHPAIHDKVMREARAL